MSIATIIEILATLLNLFYVIFLIRERIICWPFGIAGSLLSIYLFVDSRLYSEALLYSYYVGMGIWGWMRWHLRDVNDNNPVVRYTIPKHMLIVFVSSAGAIILGTLFATYSGAERPYIDAFTTAFSFAATYMQVKKVLETWLYWIVINLASIWLYHDRSLDIYAALIFVYAVLAVWGFIQWVGVYRSASTAAVPAAAV
jgi:nicotinamide mononucleotide transporter